MSFFIVPLEPLSPRIRNVTSRNIELTWQPPSNAASLGSDLLGYRVYAKELCHHITARGYRRTNGKSRRGSGQSGEKSGNGKRRGKNGLPTSNDLGHGLERPPRKCREIPPETVHGPGVTLANFYKLGALYISHNLSYLTLGSHLQI